MFIFLSFLQWLLHFIFFGPVFFALKILSGFSLLTYFIAKNLPFKKEITKNVAAIFPRENAAKIADRLLKNLSYAVFEILAIPFFKKKHFDRIVKYEGLQHIDQALKAGQGVIMISMHTGNYEMVPAFLSSLGYQGHAVLQATDNPLFKIVNRSRGYGGTKLINILEEDMYKESIKALASNALVFLLADTGALEGRHEFIQFIGKKMPVATGWLTLAQRSGAAVIPTFVQKDGPNNLFIFGSPLVIEKENREEAIKQMAEFFERHISKSPEQWILFLNSYEVGRLTKI